MTDSRQAAFPNAGHERRTRSLSEYSLTDFYSGEGDIGPSVCGGGTKSTKWCGKKARSHYIEVGKEWVGHYWL